MVSPEFTSFDFREKRLLCYDCRDLCPDWYNFWIQTGRLVAQVKIEFNLRSKYHAVGRTAEVEHAELISFCYMLSLANRYLI